MGPPPVNWSRRWDLNPRAPPSKGGEKSQTPLRLDKPGGADGGRTHDLFNAIEAFSQLNYSPTNLLNGHDGIRTRMVVWQLSGELALAD